MESIEEEKISITLFGRGAATLDTTEDEELKQVMGFVEGFETLGKEQKIKLMVHLLNKI